VKPHDETTLAQMVHDNWMQGRQKLQPLIELCKEWDRQWDGVMTPKDFPWKNCSNLNVPITSAIGDTLLSYLVAQLLGQRPYIRVKPRSNTPDRNARIMEAVIDDQAYNDSNLYQALVEAFHDGLRYGVWAVIVDWEEIGIDIPCRIAIPQYDSANDICGYTEQTLIRKKTIARPRIVPQNITEIVVSPGATCINRDGVGNPADYVIFRRLFKLDDLIAKSQNNGGPYFNTELLTRSQNQITTDEILKDKEERLGIISDHRSTGDIEGFEGWYWYDINGDGKNELCIFTIAVSGGKPVLIRKQECPYLHYKIPLVWQKLFPERGLYSKSIPAWLKDIQDELNTIHNQRRDAVSLSLLKMWKYRLGSRFDINQELYPGCMVGVIDMNDFEPVVTYEQGIVPAITEEQLLNSYIEKMTGISDYTIGRESENNAYPTATGTIALIQNSNLRIELITKYWRNGALKELGELLGELNKQFYPVENKLQPYDTAIFVSGDLEDGMLRVLISDLDGDFKYEYIGNNNLIDKNSERQQAVFLYELLKDNPLVKDNMEAIYDLTKSLLSTYGKSDIHIPSPQQLEEESINRVKQAIREAAVENRIEYINYARTKLNEMESAINRQESAREPVDKPAKQKRNTKR